MGFTKPLSPYFDYIRDERFKNIWKKYETQNKQKKNIFRGIDRFKLLQSLISRQVNLQYLTQKQIIHCFFPLKNDFEFCGIRQFISYSEDPNYKDNAKILLEKIKGNTPKGLAKTWGSYLAFKNLPLTKIRNYFGEKIALYFAFMSFFSKILGIPSFFGVVVFVLQRIYQPDNQIIIITNIIYCIYVTIWAAVFIEFWKRKENCLAIKWGQTKYEGDEVRRPQFSGTARRSLIDDEMDDVYYDPNKRYKFFVFSILITSVFICLVISEVLGIIVLRWQLTNELVFNGFDLAGPVCSSINAVQIQIFNVIFNKVAIRLNNLENHRTQSDYESSLIIKCYVFQFVNSFFSLFYIGFFKTMTEGCIVSDNGGKARVKGASCMNELYTQFMTIFIISFLKNSIELGHPYLKAKRLRKNFHKINSVIIEENYQSIRSDIDLLRDQIDKEIQLPAYITRDVDGTLGDYLELSILFGYITLFAVAFPLSGLLTSFELLIEIFVDRYKLLHMVRRPMPIGAKNINNWKIIFIFNSVAAIFTNAAIICFTMPTFNNWESAANNKFLIYACFCVFMLFLRVAVAFYVPDIPLKHNLIVKRHEKLHHRFIIKILNKGKKKKDIKGFLNSKIYCTHDGK
jgi:anoctamin-10